jgi:acyl-CoA thioesterase
MPNSPEGYLAATAVAPDGDDRWTGFLHDGWDIVGRTNGGYMLSILSRASSQATNGRSPVSITGHFTAPGQAGPIAIETEVVRSGRRLSVVRSRMIQEGRILLDALGTFAKPGDGELEILLSDATPIELPSPEESVRGVPSDDAPFPPPFVGKIDMRPGPRLAGIFTTGPYGDAALEGWFGLLDDEPLDAHALVIASDAFPPTAFTAGLPLGWTPTLELTVHVRDPFPKGWIKCEFRSRFVSGGYIEEDGLMWDENGRLVAQSRQLAMVAKG